MTKRRRAGSPVLASPLENDDILSEILLRLPPMPSSLPHVSLVCKRWRRLVSDRIFLRRFRAHHSRNAPLLGFFTHAAGEPSFTPTLDPPDRLPRDRFPLNLDEGCRILGCRHGLLLILNQTRLHVLVWDPVTGDASRVAFPPGFGDGEGATVTHGAVLRATRDVNVGDHHSIPFLVALIVNKKGCKQVFARLYSSVTGLWGDVISVACPSMVLVPIPCPLVPCTLVGGSLYWMLGYNSAGILEFDLARQHLAILDLPQDISAYKWCHYRVMPTEGGKLGLVCLSGYNAQLWMMNKGCDGVARWVLGRIIELDKLLSLDTAIASPPLIFGFSEEDNVSFLATCVGVFMVQLESMQIKKSFELLTLPNYHPFASVYTAGLGSDDGHDGPQLLGNA